MTMFDGLFKAGDWMLNHGGQVALDAAGFIPGVNVLTEGAESLYHGAHAANDYADGNNKEAPKMLAPDAEQANEIPFMGGLPGLMVSAMTGAENHEEKEKGTSE